MNNLLNQLRPYLEEDNLANRINRFARKFYIEKVQGPLVTRIIKLANLYPEPTKSDTRKWNSHAWLDAFDEYLQHEGNKKVFQIVAAIRKVLVGKYESSSEYSERVDVFLEIIARKYINGDFHKRKAWTPTNRWKDIEVIRRREQLRQDLEKDVEDMRASRI